MAAPEGNTNASKQYRLWAETLRRIGIQDEAKRLRRVAEAIYAKAEEGDVQAAKEIGDRIDGKAVQTIAGDPDNPVQVIVNKVAK